MAKRKRTASAANEKRHIFTPPFFTIPREVRDMIYKLVLVVESELVPYPAWWEREAAKAPHPDPEILLVCKAIAEEARPVLYGQNKWRIASNFPDKKTIFTMHPLLFRDITLLFDGRDLTEEAKDQINMHYRQRMISAYGVRYRSETEAECILWKYMECVSSRWAPKKAAVFSMDNLRSLSINVGSLQCPAGYPYPRIDFLERAFCNGTLRDFKGDLMDRLDRWYIMQGSSKGAPEMHIVGLLTELEVLLFRGRLRNLGIEVVVEAGKDLDNTRIGDTGAAWSAVVKARLGE